MKLTGNIIFITAGGSGIGRGLAEAFHALRNQVIISGRRLSVLETVCVANPGMQCAVFNANDLQDIKRIARYLAEKAPGLNVLINDAGFQQPENLLNQQEDLTDAESTITTNLLGLIRITAALLVYMDFLDMHAIRKDLITDIFYERMAAPPARPRIKFGWIRLRLYDSVSER